MVPNINTRSSLIIILLGFVIFPNLVLADYYTGYVFYEVKKDLGTITVGYKEIRGQKPVDHLTKNQKEYERKNIFLTHDYEDRNARVFIRNENIAGQEIKVKIRISPPRGRGMGGAVPNSTVRVMVDGKLRVNSTLGLNFKSGLEVDEIIIHFEDKSIEARFINTSGEGGVVYVFYGDFDERIENGSVGLPNSHKDYDDLSKKLVVRKN